MLIINYNINYKYLNRFFCIYSMITINYNKNEYINGTYVLENALVYSKGCRSSRDLIKKKNIDLTKYIFAKNKGDEWIITDGKSIKFDKVFFKKSFINTLPELNKIKIDDKCIEIIPNIIELNDNEKFKDNNGNIIEIETYGERNIDKIYFNAKDVSNGFQMDQLEKVIKDSRYNGYTEGIHYKYFICKSSGSY